MTRERTQKRTKKHSRADATEKIGEFLRGHLAGPRRLVEFSVIEVVRDEQGRRDPTKSRAPFRKPITTAASAEVLSRILENCIEELERFEFLVSLYASGRHRGPDGPWKVLTLNVADPITGEFSDPLPIAAAADATPASVREGFREQVKSWWNKNPQLRMIHQAMIGEVERREWNWSDFDRRRGKVQREKAAIDVRWREICRIAHPLWMLGVLTEPERARFAETSRETILKYLGSGAYRSQHFDRTRTKSISSVTVRDKRKSVRKTSQNKKTKS